MGSIDLTQEFRAARRCLSGRGLAAGSTHGLAALCRAPSLMNREVPFIIIVHSAVEPILVLLMGAGSAATWPLKLRYAPSQPSIPARSDPRVGSTILTARR